MTDDCDMPCHHMEVPCGEKGKNHQYQGCGPTGQAPKWYLS